MRSEIKARIAYFVAVYVLGLAAYAGLMHYLDLWWVLFP